MIKIISKFSISYIRKNKKQSLLSFLCILLCVASMLTTALITSSYIKSYSENNRTENGTQHGVIKDVSLDEIKKIKEDPRMDAAGVVTLYANSPVKGNLFDEHVLLGTMDQTAQKLSKVKLLNGRLPTSPNEIVLEKHMFSILNLKEAIGGNLTLTLHPINGGEEFEKAYTVVGILSNYSKKQGGTKDNKKLREHLPNAIVAPSPADDEMSPVNQALVQVSSGYDYKKVIEEVSSGHGVYLNAAVYDHVVSNFLSNDANMNFMLVTIVLSVLFIGLFAIYSDVSLSKLKMQTCLRKLKYAGASCNQILQFLCLRALYLFGAAVIAGFLIGLFVSFAVSKLVLDKIIPYFELRADPLVLLSVALISLAAVLLFQIISSVDFVYKKPGQGKNKSIVQQKDIHIKLKKPMALWGVKSFLINLPSTSSIIVSFAICFTAICSVLFIANVNVAQLQDTVASDYRIDNYNWRYMSSGINLYPDLFAGMEEKEWKEIEKIEEVRHCYPIKRLMVKYKIDLTKENFPKLHFYNEEQYPEPDHIKQNSYERNEMRKHGLGEGYTPQDIILSGVDDSVLDSLKKYVVQGEINLQSLKSGKEVLLVAGAENPAPPIGLNETMNLSLLTLKNKNDVSKGINAKEFRVKVGAVIDIKDKNPFLSDVCSGQFIFSNDAFSQLSIPIRTNFLHISLKDPQKYEETETILAKLKDVYPNMFLTSKRAEVESQRLYVQTIKTICYSLTLILLLFSFINLWNLIHTKIAQQTQVWGALRAIGVEKKDAYHYQVTELIMICASGFLISLPISAAISFLIGRNMELANWGSYIPVLPAVALLLFLCAFISLLCLPPIAKIFQRDIVRLIHPSN